MYIMQIELRHPLAKVPTYAHPGDAAFDIYTIEEHSLFPGARHTFKTGVASSFSPKYFLKLEGRSGLAHHHGIAVVGGVIDASYRGEWGIILVNTGKDVVFVKTGDRVCQGIMLPVPRFKLKVVKALKATKRGHGRFGSSGR